MTDPEMNKLVIQTAREVGLRVNVDGKMLNDNYTNVMGSFPSLVRFARALLSASKPAVAQDDVRALSEGYRRGTKDAFHLVNMLNANRQGRTADETCSYIVRTLAEQVNSGEVPAAPATDTEEDAYVIKRLSTLLAEVAGALMGDDADVSGVEVLAKLPEVAKTLKLEVELYRANAAAPAQSGEPVLDRAAKVGGTRFGKGVKWSTVIGAAQRVYEYEVTPEKEAVRIERARATLAEIRGESTAPQPAQMERALTCALCGGCGPIVGCDACQSTGKIAAQPAIGGKG
jgi:hypothetical protein